MKLFLIFIVHGFLSILCTQTWFVPDEHWQVTEVAHYLVFGYGYLTWEWHYAIRSAAYPLFIAFGYWVLKLLSLDHVFLLIYLPKIFHVLLSSVSYVCLCDLAKVLYGSSARLWTALSVSSSWVLFYCMNRTLYNALETNFCILGLYYFPWTTKKLTWENSWKYVILVAASIIVRPTALIIWMPLCFYHIIISLKQQAFKRICGLYCLTGMLAVCCQLLIDYMFYKRVVFTPYQFLKFNFLNDLSSHYGVHPWHWYWMQGLPLLFTTHLIPLIPAVIKNHKQPLFLLLLWLTFFYSLLGHKEFRFLLPIVPCGMAIVGNYLAQTAKKSFRKAFWMVFILFVTNIPLALYLGLFHQRGSLDVMKYLRTEAKQHENMKVVFLMPCHSTPFYSYLHTNISLDFLSCEPNLHGEENYVDEADQFYQNPLTWVNANLNKADTSNGSRISRFLPTHIVMYDSLNKEIILFLQKNNFELCNQFFHTHFPEGRISSRIQVICKR